MTDTPSTTVALKAFSKAAREETAFRQLNDEVFKQFAELQIRTGKAESALKTAAREEGQDIEDKFFTVKVTQRWSKSYQPEKAIEVATPKERKIIESECIVTSIDRSKFEQLVKDDKISKQVAQAAFREEPLTASVTIKAKEIE